ncbi:MAG: energy-coupling factor transporter ATPase [Bacillota bacterium]
MRQNPGSDYISFKNVVYRYENRRENAVSSITATINRGDFIAVIGPNGSGKSTLARHINGLLLPTEGTVTVDGMDTRDPAGLVNVRRRVGFVFQNPDNQVIGNTVEEDIAFGPENLGQNPGSIRESVDYAMSVVGLSEVAKRPPHMLSGGQKQLLAIAGAIAMKTECLVLDEPTSMIGPAGRKSLIQLLLNLKSRYRMTLVMVTHFLEETVFADRVFVMDKGRLVSAGSPPEIFSSGSLLKDIGLEVPGPVELANRLRQSGFDIPDPVLSVDELVSCICRL